MKRIRNLKAVQNENYVLILVAGILLALSLFIVAIGVVYVTVFQWWSLAMVLSGITSMWCSYMSVKRDDPSWILLDLLLKP